MTAEITNSNMLGLADIINKDNIQQDKIGALDDLNGSVIPPSEYEDFKSLLFPSSDGSNSETEEDYSDDSIKTKVGGDKTKVTKYDDDSGTYDEEDEEEEYDEQGSSDSSSMDIDIKNPSAKNIKGIVKLEPSTKGGAVAKTKVVKDTHSKILAEIGDMREILIKNGINIPNYKQKEIKRNKNYAKEILDVLKNLDNDNKTADDMTHLLRFVLNILCKTLNGRHEVFGYKLDLRGYKTLVMSDIKDIREDTVEFASFVRKKLGISTTKFFRIFKIFILNAGITIIRNNDSGNNVDVFDEDEYSDDEDVGTEDEEEDEESENDEVSNSK